MEDQLYQIAKSFYPVSKASVKTISQLAREKRIGKGEPIVEKGRRNLSEYFVLDGICKTAVKNDEGVETTLTFFMGGSVVSPFTTRVQNERSTIGVVAVTDVRLAEISARDFEQLMIDNIEIREFGNAVLRRELMDKVEKEIGLASLSAKERLRALRNKYPGIENMAPHRDIASYLGITHVSLSRLRASS